MWKLYDQLCTPLSDYCWIFVPFFFCVVVIFNAFVHILSRLGTVLDVNCGENDNERYADETTCMYIFVSIFVHEHSARSTLYL